MSSATSIPRGILTIREQGMNGNRRYDLAVQDPAYHQELQKALQTPEVASLINRIQNFRIVINIPAVPQNAFDDMKNLSKENHNRKMLEERGILRILGPLSDLRDAQALTKALTKMLTFAQASCNVFFYRRELLGALVLSGSLACEYCLPATLTENDQL